MDVEQLTDEQISTLTPEQITILETEPERLDEILAAQEAKAAQDDTPDKPKQEEKPSAANGAGKEGDEDTPVVLTKNGKGVIPYEQHKGLRVENATLREQLAAAQQENSKATEKLESLLKQKDAAVGEDIEIADDAIKAHMDTLKDDLPELHAVISAVLARSRTQGTQLASTLAELKREREEAARASQLSVEEQVAEAKENNPDLVHWELNDPEAWDEALKQDEILRTSSTKWGTKPYEERFAEVVRRVRAILPDASLPSKISASEQTRAAAKARLEKAPARKPTTLSDIHGGENPASEQEQFENLSPFELTQKLMKMSPQQAAAMRAELD